MKVDLQVQKLTPKGQPTRQRIIDGAASKSQLFQYFPRGKDQPNRRRCACSATSSRI